MKKIGPLFWLIEIDEGAGVLELVGAFICGIIALISVFLPWITVHMPSCTIDAFGVIHCSEGFVVSGWTALTTPHYFISWYPYPYFVLPGSILMIVFALIAVILALRTRSKAGKLTFCSLAMLSSLLCFIASMLALWDSGELHYGLVLSTVFSLIGLIDSALAIAKFNNPKNKETPPDPLF